MDAVTYFLTYPQTDISHDDVYAALQLIKPVVWARVARERHEDGNYHIHAIVRFGARLRFRSNAQVFDINGRHPNVQVPRRIKDVLEYCAKEGDYRDYGVLPGQTNVFDELQQAAASGDRARLDRVAITNRVSKQWADHIWEQHCPAIHDVLEPSGGIECMQLQQLQLTSVVTAIIGPSGCGKTSWAMRVAPKPALWCRHMDDLRKLRPHHHKCIIFDDMDFKHMPRTAQIHIVDTHMPSSIHVRYGTVTIPAGLHKIFTGNEKMFVDDEAVNRRVRYFNIISLVV